MRILYVGGGFVGVCSAAVAADFNHSILVYDVDENKVEKLASFDKKNIEECLYEQELSELLIKNKDNIRFTFDYSEVTGFLDEADAVFMCVPTPEKINSQGETDLTFFNLAIEKLSEALLKRNNGTQNKYIVVVNKSTVPIDTLEKTEKFLADKGVINFGVVSNPEFLVEGKAVIGSRQPDRVVIGAEKEKDFLVMRQIYSSFYNNKDIIYLEVDGKEAAAGKLLANFLLFDKVITTFEVVGRLCEAKTGLNFENLKKILTTDKRIGTWGFHNSLYAGGSCWLKDAYSLAHQFEEAGINSSRIREALTANYFQRDNFYDRFKKSISLENKTIAILGVAFKQETNDTRNSPAFPIVEYLLRDGVKEIKIFDPRGLEMFKNNIGNLEGKEKIKYVYNEEESLLGSDACIILTDWPQFKFLNEKIKNTCKLPYVIADGRRILCSQYDDLKNSGYKIIAVGEKDIL